MASGIKARVYAAAVTVVKGNLGDAGDLTDTARENLDETSTVVSRAGSRRKLVRAKSCAEWAKAATAKAANRRVRLQIRTSTKKLPQE